MMCHVSTKRRVDGLSFRQIIQTLDDVVDEKELTIFAAVGFGIVPVTKSIYEVYANVTGRGLIEEQSVVHSEEVSKQKKSKIREAYEVLTPWDDEKLEESIHDKLSEIADAASSITKGEEETKTTTDSSKRNVLIPNKLKSLFAKKRMKKGPMKQFKDTVLYHVVDHVSQASQIGMAVAVVDSVAHVMKLMGFHFQVRETSMGALH
jgi:hypothetical protein